MGVHITFVKSSRLDKWRKDQLRMMVAGGNSKARAFFRERGQSTSGSDRRAKYTSKAANLYKKHLKRQATAQETITELDRILSSTGHANGDQNGAPALTGLDALEAALRQQSLEEDGVEAPTSKASRSPASDPAGTAGGVVSPKIEVQERQEEEAKAKATSPVSAPPSETKKENEGLGDDFWGKDGDTGNTETKVERSSSLSSFSSKGKRVSTKSLLSSRRRTGGSRLGGSSRLSGLSRRQTSSKTVRQADPEPYAATPKSVESPPTPATKRSTGSSKLDHISTGANNKYGGISSDKVHGSRNDSSSAYFDPSTNSMSNSQPVEEEDDAIAQIGNYASTFFAQFQQD